MILDLDAGAAVEDLHGVGIDQTWVLHAAGLATLAPERTAVAYSHGVNSPSSLPYATEPTQHGVRGACGRTPWNTRTARSDKNAAQLLKNTQFSDQDQLTCLIGGSGLN